MSSPKIIIETMLVLYACTLCLYFMLVLYACTRFTHEIYMYTQYWPWHPVNKLFTNYP